MPTPDPRIFDRRFARNLWSLTRIYWTSPDAPKGAGLLGLCVALELGTVYGNVRLAIAQSHVFDAVQNKELPAFLTAMEIFLAVALGVVLVSTYRIYVRNILQMRWRQHLTDHLLWEWMSPTAYCHRELHHNDTDNPDQRVAEDAQSYVASALGLSLSLLSAVATLISFSGILWSLSGEWPLRLGAKEIWIPGLMMWVAIAYALLATWLTNRVGRSLVSINFDRLRYEADFRYGLVRFRDHVEAVALARGEVVERRGALARFQNVVLNWWRLIGAQRNLTLLTTGIGQANGVIPLLVAAPAFFAGRMTLGALTETGIAYGQVSGALSWFVDAYQEIAQWRASIERLSTFREAIADTAAELAHGERIQLHNVETPGLRLVHVNLTQTDGTKVASDIDIEIGAGERVALVGPAGMVKTTLFRAIAGIWPFGSGTIETPAAVHSAFLSHRPYIPLGSLREAVSYPAPAQAFPDDKVREALRLVGLDHLESKLDENDSWEQQLSSDEQQRLVFARTLLHHPDWIVMDDATAALDEAMEKLVYQLFAERLAGATVVSITNRPTIVQYHQRSLPIAAAAATA